MACSALFSLRRRSLSCMTAHRKQRSHYLLMLHFTHFWGQHREALCLRRATSSKSCSSEARFSASPIGDLEAEALHVCAKFTPYKSTDSHVCIDTQKIGDPALDTPCLTLIWFLRFAHLSDKGLSDIFCVLARSLALSEETTARAVWMERSACISLERLVPKSESSLVVVPMPSRPSEKLTWFRCIKDPVITWRLFFNFKCIFLLYQKKVQA